MENKNLEYVLGCPHHYNDDDRLFWKAWLDNPNLVSKRVIKRLKLQKEYQKIYNRIGVLYQPEDELKSWIKPPKKEKPEKPPKKEKPEKEKIISASPHIEPTYGSRNYLLAIEVNKKQNALRQKQEADEEKYKHLLGDNYRKAILSMRSKKTCCCIYKAHHEILKDDPDRLTTEFIQTISRCKCDKLEEEK
jgi:hypothetical protein